MPPQETSLSVQDFIRAEAKAAGLPEALALAVAEQESSFNPAAIGKEFEVRPGERTRAVGLFQILPSTYDLYKTDADPDINDPVHNTRVGVRYLKRLFDKHGGNLDKMAAEYGGVVRDTTYVPQLTAKVLRWQDILNPERRNPNTTQLSQATGLREPTWLQRHPRLKHFIDSYNPAYQQGRQNIAGSVGSLVGGGVGAVAGGSSGTATAPGPGTAAGAIWGRRIGSVGGATLFGGLEQALIEEGPIGRMIGAPPPPPDTTYWGRVTRAGAEQGLTDVVGQGTAGVVRGVGKRAVQSSVAKSAFEHLDDARARTRDVFATSLRAARGTAADKAAALAADIADRRARLREWWRVNEIRPARDAEAALAEAQAAERLRLTGYHDAEIAAARARAEQGVAGATLARDEALDAFRNAHQANLTASVPNAQEAGRAVAEVFEGSATAYRRQLGEAVDEAALTGPERNIRALKAEADRLAREELGAVSPPPTPPAPPPLYDASGRLIQSAPSPPANPATQLADQAREALLKPVQQHKAVEVIERILAAPDDVPFHILHQFKKDLQDALRTTYDKAVRTRVQGMTMHLSKLLRETLGGHAPYEEATRAYEDIIPAYTSQLGKTIRATARTSPEDIADLIDINKPTQAGFLTRLMTEAAEGGGGAAGSQAGRAALKQVQDHWFFRNVIEGPIETLGERLLTLRRHPEFVRAFLGDQRMRGLITRAQELAAEYPALAARHEGFLATARATGQEGIDQAIAGKTGALGAFEKAAAADLQEAAARVRKTIDAANARKDAFNRQTRGERARRQQDTRAAIEAQRTTSPESLAADTAARKLEAFNRSTLGGSMRSPTQVAADAINAGSRPLSNAFGALGLARLLAGASDADLAAYLIHSKTPIKQLTQVLINPWTAHGLRVVGTGVTKPIILGGKPRAEDRQTAAPPPRK